MAPLHIILLAKSLVKIDKSTIEAGDGGIFSIDIEYILGSSTNIESELRVDEGNDNSEMQNNDLEDCNLEDD